MQVAVYVTLSLSFSFVCYTPPTTNRHTMLVYAYMSSPERRCVECEPAAIDLTRLRIARGEQA